MVNLIDGLIDVKDSGHFMEIVNGICLDSDDVMVSYDVSSLFTNVPIQASY